MDEPVFAELREEAAETEPSPDQTSEEQVGASIEVTADGCEALCGQDCGEAFKEESSYLQHCLQHQPNNADLDNHTDGLPSVETDCNTPHYCALCSLSFVKQSDFELHVKTHDAASPNESPGQNRKKTSRLPIHVCPDCGKAYKLLGLLRNHERTHRPPPKTYFSDLDLLKKKSFQCEICERSYTRASALDAHRRCHEENLVKPKTRSPVDETQTTRAKEVVKSAEIQPVKIEPVESQIQPAEIQPAVSATHFDCACGRSFISLSRLKTHQRFSRKCQCSPEKVTPKPKKSPDGFECSECQRTFSNKIASYNHQRWHANQANASTNSTKFSCEECGKEFQSLSFFYKHQRTAHSGETPAKSFLHQVCQLQKKAIECEVCGLKFSRPSALHSHHLLHANEFKDEERDTVSCNSLSPQKMSKFVKKEEDRITTSMVQSDNLDLATMAEETHVGENEDDMEAYELSDFNVLVISASESEDEPIRDLNPELELLCESDQERKDEGEIDSSSGLNNMDLKIVQIDFEDPDEPCAPMSTDAVEKGRFDCPECGGWYSSISSLRIHRRWHSAQKRGQQMEGQSVPANSFDKSDSSSYLTHCSYINAHSDQNSNYVALPAEGSEKKSFVCTECGQVFSHLSVLIAHQLHQRKELHTYLHTSGLSNHTKTCSVQKKENILTMKDYNPKKTLLGPKTYYCEQCGKGFWSLGAYSHHMQSETECTDLRLRKGFTGSMLSANRHTRSAVKIACPVCGRKFRHKRMMALHMRKHENGNHKCELCNRSFRLFSSLLRHQVVHSDQLLPPPVKSFQHQMEQLKKNTYSCPDCGKLFSRAKALQFHMKSHGYETGYAPSSVQSTTVLEDLQCTTCFALFNSKASLRTHQKLCVKRKRQQVKIEESTQNVNALKQHENNISLSMQEKLDQGRVHAELMCEMGSKEQEMASGIKSTGELNNMGEKSFSVSPTINFQRLHDEDHDFKQNADVSYSQMLQPTNREEKKKGFFTCLECGEGFLSNWALSSHKRLHNKKHFLSSLEEEQGLTQSVYDKKKHFDSREPSGQQRDEASDDTIDNLSQQVDKNNSGPVKPKYHTCPICLMTFAKARGLCAHNWQVHSMDKGSTKEVSAMIKTECHFSNRDVNDTESQAFETVPATVKHFHVDEQKSKVKPSGKPFSCFDCGKECTCPGSLLNNEKLCLAVEQHFKLDCQTSEALTEVSPPLSHVPDITDKCFFKCKKCGKAFPTEEQLGSHKVKAKSRPFSCALCCHSFWTKNRLQQHLAWHDQVRCRLPNEVRYRLSATVSSRPLISSLSADDNKAASLSSSTASQLISQSASTSQSSQHCGKSIVSPAALQRQNTQLGNTILYSCPICPTTFNEIQAFIDHRQECVGGDKRCALPSECTNEFTCYECGTTFCQETDLHQHCCDHVHQAHYT